MVKKNKFLIISILIISLVFSMTALAQEEDNEELYEGKEFRNPFLEYKEPEPVPQPDDDAAASGNEDAQTMDGSEEPPEPVITFEMVRNGLPFNLSGIISSNKERIALLNTGEGTEFVRGYYKEAGYEVIDIQGDSVIVRNRGFRLRLKIGGEIDEI